MDESVGPDVTERRTDIAVMTPVDTTEIVDAATLTEDIEEPARGNTNDKVYQGIDQCSLLPLEAPAINCRRPLFTAKRKLLYEHLHEIPTSRLCNSLTEPSQINDSSNQKQECNIDGQSEDTPKGSCDRMENVKASRQIPLSPNFSPSCKVLSSLKSVSPLTKVFKSFDVQRSQAAALELKQPSYSLSTAAASPPVMIPSFSVPCLLSPHPMPQTFILDSPPLQSQISKSASLASKELLAGVGSNSERNSDLSQNTCTRVQMSQPSSCMGRTISYNSIVYATPTTSNISCSSSVTRDITSPNPVYSECKSANGKSNSVTLESMLRGHRQSTASGLQDPNMNLYVHVSSQPPCSKGAQLKQVLSQGSPRRQAQRETQPSMRCPRMIHCNNCGHKIDLKDYIQSQQRTDNSEVSAPAHKSLPTKLSITNAGLTVFDLEAICDTGYIDHNLSTSATGKQQSRQGNHPMLCYITNEDHEKSPGFRKLPYPSTGCGITKPHFPHSDELTQSFVPILSDTVEGLILAESWGKLDTLDVNEMLELLETTSELRYCSNRSTCTGVTSNNQFGTTQKDKETTLESVQTVKHIITEDYSPCHSSSGKIFQSGKSGSKSHPIANSSNDSGKSDSSNSDSEIHVVKCEKPDGGRVLRSRAKQPTSRICKKRPRKKQLKKTNQNEKNKQKAAA